MPDTERKHLPAQQARGVSGGSGCVVAFFIIFGLPFLAAGVALALLPREAFRPDDGGDLPPWLPWCLALLFSGAGLFLGGKGVLAVIERSRLKARRERHPQEPWRADHPWDPAGASYSPGASLPGQLAALAFMTFLLAPFNYFTFYEPREDMPLWARALVVLFDVVLALVLVGIALTVVHQAKYGRARLVFQSFPFFLGDALSARLGTSRPIGHFKKLTFTLRCIEERTETRRSGNKTTIRTVCDQLWADEVALEGGAAREGHEVPVRFDLPEGDYGTRLSKAPARYWELAVAADTPGLDFAAKFLVPVYSRT
jgi:hypothetical protein